MAKITGVKDLIRSKYVSMELAEMRGNDPDGLNWSDISDTPHRLIS